MSTIYLYAHGGSGNHGCEAIVRSTVALLNNAGFNKIILISSNPEEDFFYGLDEVCEIKKDIMPYSKKSFDFLKAYAALKIKKDYIPLDKMDYRKAFTNMKKGDIALSIGGDNYCYANVKKYVMLHELIKEKGVATVLWGCSVEPELLNDKVIAEDLAKYDLVTARESISYNALKKVNDNTILVADSAFLLEPKKISDYKDGELENTIGINLSPMVIDSECSKGIVLRNYVKLIKWLLKETDMRIALVPHVVWQNGDDRQVLKLLYDEFKNTKRITLCDDYNCMELKWLISQCRFFVGARTHSTIAAYSSEVPTLVVGYSVKAKGIARDIFESEKRYVIPVQTLRKDDDLKNAVSWMIENEESILNRYKDIMMEYKESVKNSIPNLLALK